MNYRAAIVGAGKIGAMQDNPQSTAILTHAHGYKACQGFELVGFVDSNRESALAASDRWGGRTFATIDELLRDEPIDVVSVCLPDELHYEALRALSDKPVRFVFLEKPAVKTPAEADDIRALYRDLPVRVQVNYTRRFVPEIQKLREGIRSGDYGSFLSGAGYYGKGLLHNGSHMLDLMQFLVGEVDQVTKIEQVADFYEDDPSVSALLTVRSGGSFHLRHVDSRKFHIFEMDLIFEKRRFRIYQLGTVIEEYSVGDSSLFDGFRTLNWEKKYPTQHTAAMYHAISNIRENLDGNEPLVCTLEESLETVKTCSRIMRG